MKHAIIALGCVVMLSACNWIGNVTGLNQESNKAIGAACRQTGRSLEECFLRNPEADKAHMFDGWRQMHEYMTKYKLEVMLPPVDLIAEASAATTDVAHSAGTETKLTSSKILNSKQADDWAKTDPEVQAVIAAMNSGNPPPESAKKIIEPQAAQLKEISNKKPEEKMSVEDKKILDSINQMNNSTDKKQASQASGSTQKKSGVESALSTPAKQPPKP